MKYTRFESHVPLMTTVNGNGEPFLLIHRYQRWIVLHSNFSLIRANHIQHKKKVSLHVLLSVIMCAQRGGGTNLWSGIQVLAFIRTYYIGRRSRVGIYV